MTYRWKIPGVIPVEAEKAQKELERIWQEQKSLSPGVIVEGSRAKKSVLHNAFEWDNRKAAEAYRQVQARTILRMIVKTDPTDALQSCRPVRAFVRAKEGYMPMQAAEEHEPAMQGLLKQAKRDTLAFLLKYRDLKQLAKNETIREMISELERSL